MTSAPRVQRITTRNAAFQQWQSLLTNRTKRHRAGELLVQGVRPVTLAVESGWTVRTWLVDAERPLSSWAHAMLDRVRTRRFEVSTELMRELGGKDDDAPELLAVVEMPPDDLGRVPVGDGFLGVVLDRPTSPGNVGTVARSLDAFGGSGLVVAGHAADPYDPRAVRASTGSIFAVPTVRVPSGREVLDWVAERRSGGRPLTLVGTDEDGDVELAAHDLTGPTLVLTGNETSGLSSAWREACDVMVSIPMLGSASSLNAASATTVVLYEAVRQRRSVAL
ncbi:rRNA methyltransferase [Cellulosimicrobium arenosum]|uniref:rRNA methyltransferase n=2 Tax=Cellulosimicrobium arenosum TaxID=2708133 RepID=A0A927IZP1_9MICO|nr:TrmH family RNA methyltransferase [Cellulosimicrobium arenosum]MBD8078879.1 rRNA methyltransferase [Cellulosimicrobium arenosum]